MRYCINGQILIACMALKTAKYCPHNSIKAKRKWQGRKCENCDLMWSEVVAQTFIIRIHIQSDKEKDVDV